MGSLPQHGRIDCTLCYQGSSVIFDVTCRAEDGWRIRANPLAWGNSEPQILVLGFSKGPNQSGGLAFADHNEIAFRGGRANVGKIFAHIGLIPPGDTQQSKRQVDELIADRSGRFPLARLFAAQSNASTNPDAGKARAATCWENL